MQTENRPASNRFFVKDVLSTGEVAAACNLTKHTIISAIEKGDLRASRTPGGHNRIRREDAVAFMEKYNFFSALSATVLVVDPEDFLVEIVEETLAGGEAAVHHVRSGYEAAKTIERVHPDLVVADADLGHRTLEAIAKHLEEDGYPSATKLVVISSRQEAPAFREMCPRGRVLTKPFSMDELQDALGELHEA